MSKKRKNKRKKKVKKTSFIPTKVNILFDQVYNHEKIFYFKEDKNNPDIATFYVVTKEPNGNINIPLISHIDTTDDDCNDMIYGILTSFSEISSTFTKTVLKRRSSSGNSYVMIENDNGDKLITDVYTKEELNDILGEDNEHFDCNTKHYQTYLKKLLAAAIKNKIYKPKDESKRKTKCIYLSSGEVYHNDDDIS